MQHSSNDGPQLPLHNLVKFKVSERLQQVSQALTVVVAKLRRWRRFVQNGNAPRCRLQQGWGLEFGVWGLGFGVWGLGFGVSSPFRLVAATNTSSARAQRQRAAAAGGRGGGKCMSKLSSECCTLHTSPASQLPATAQSLLAAASARKMVRENQFQFQGEGHTW
jgi:hypothetical protein